MERPSESSLRMLPARPSLLEERWLTGLLSAFNLCLVVNKRAAEGYREQIEIIAGVGFEPTTFGL